MNITKFKTEKSSWVKGILVLLGLTAVMIWRSQIVEIFLLIGDREAIVAFLEPYGMLGPVLLSIILTLQVFLAFIPGHAFIVAGGYIYGLLVGALITQVSTVFASQLAYLLTRRYGRPLVDRMAPANLIDHWNKLAEKQGGFFFFFSFILPIFPNDLMSFVAGLSNISSRRFFLANFLGRLPCAIFVTLIGSHGFELPLYFWVVIIILIVGLCLLWKTISAQVEQRVFRKFSSTSCLA